jgi:endo-1,4-beta-xylanase
MLPLKTPAFSHERFNRALIFVLAFSGAACSSDVTGPSEMPNDTTPAPLALRQVADARGLRIGAAADRLFRNDADGTQFKTILSREFNMLTAENDMKHQRLQPSRGVFTFLRADSLVAFAEANGMQVRGHTLVWHSQNANWLANGSWTPGEARTLLIDHVRTVVDHFKGRIVAWDVVNEAFNDDGTLRGTIWNNTIGRDYIELAFRTAAAADPQAQLFYNDYNIEGINPKSDSAYALITRLLGAGVPIHGIGFQGHFQVGGLPTRPSLTANIARFAALGLKVHFTEVDVRMPQPSTAAQQATQAANYRELVDVCLSSSACRTFVLWGVTDRETWVPSTFPGWGEPLLFDSAYRPKIAYWQIHNLLSGR